MQKLLDHMRWFDPFARFGLLAWSAVEIHSSGLQMSLLTVAMFATVLFLIILDIGRLRLKIVRRHPAVFSVISIILCLAILAVKRFDVIQVYYFFLLDDIFKMHAEKTRNWLIFGHFDGFIAVEIYVIFIIEQKSFRQNFFSVFVLLSSYAILLFVFAVIHYYKWDRDQLKTLNSRLIEYSFQERDYLVANERSHISQELHDSLGHSLMATLMNVRYLKAIQGKSPDESRKQIDEIENLLKECVENLRGSVYSLKELDENISLREEVERIIHEFDNLGLVKIRLDYDDKIDESPNPIKSILYKTIREGITNSIQHGNASAVQISIQLTGDQIELILKDNGSGCEDILKSYGLNGIVDRIREVGGEVWFTSAKNKGFFTKALLPGGNEK